MQSTLIPRDAHPVSRKDISPHALKVLYRLKEAGFEAYLVGGGVRDLLLGKKPKDFDVATNAKPEEVRKVFRNCRLVGRRFRLAHVQFGQEIIEVSTFRANHQDSGSTAGKTLDETGMLLRDNVYGSIEEDAIRRDFTVNALYYSIDGFSITDFVGGYQDLQQRQLRLIGDPERRYREDPVRMLRTLRFMAKLDFNADPATLAPIRELAELLAQIPAARLIDEVFKLLDAGFALPAWKLLQQHQVWPVLFPLEQQLPPEQQAQQQRLTAALLELADAERASKPLSQALLLAGLLWQPLQSQWQQLITTGMAPIPAFQQAMSLCIEQQNQRVAVVKRIAFDIRDIWLLQLRLEQRPLNRIQQVLNQPWFGAGLDLLWLRCQAGEDFAEQHTWWLDYFDADQNQRDQMFIQLRERNKTTSSKPKAKRRKKPPTAKVEL